MKGAPVGILSIDVLFFAQVPGDSDLSDREIIDALKAMREERIHQTDTVAQEESEVHPNLRMPLNYQDETRSH